MQGVSDPIIIIISSIILLWSFFWKGVALWTAAKHSQKKWFAFLIICIFPVILYNAIAIIDLIYLFFFAEKKLTFKEIQSWKKYLYKNTSQKK